MKQRLFLPFLLAVALPGCGSLSPGSVPELATMSPLTIAPQDMQADVTLPTGVRIAERGTTLFLGARRSDTGAETGRAFDLHVVDTKEGSVRVALSDADADAFTATQARIAAWKSEAPRATKGTLSVTLNACQVGKGPADDAVFSVVLPETETRSRLPLLENVPIAKALSNETEPAACDGA